MRIRTRAIIATAGLAVATVALSAAPASAKLPEASEQCIKLLEANGSINDCQQAPSPLKPETNEILWGSAAFLVLLVAMWKWGVPAVKNMEKAREDRIRGDLEGAEHAKRDVDVLKAQYEAQLADAKAEAARIIDEARQQAEVVKRDIEATANAHAQERLAKSADDVRIASERAMADLRQQVGVMSVELAGKIVERNLDVATQQSLIDSYISSVGSN